MRLVARFTVSDGTSQTQAGQPGWIDVPRDLRTIPYDGERSADRREHTLPAATAGPQGEASMDAQRMDRIARTLASGLSRRGALKGLAVALDFSVVGAAISPAAAAPPLGWCSCLYLCEPGTPTEYPVVRCKTHCPTTLHDHRTVCSYQADKSGCGYPSKQACEL